MTFPMFTPIPKAKDTKQDYKNHPLATGPYMFDPTSAGTSLTLKKNPNWDPNTDPVRHQYAGRVRLQVGRRRGQAAAGGPEQRRRRRQRASTTTSSTRR